ncbi:HAD-IB family phosphatase [Silvanigrella aquatica]|uniref:Haloacid dehalogenase n=1 Tax=Silvanigrella aquatica TaxID=1915309 RepID=A0A1L4D0Z7_9BACT|nr:HAD-IB family phosphatase [Silvanigrella aquatica]APJ03871.1 hypothetical protein AXG55_08105 [Silvanigrella aquatica]
MQRPRYAFFDFDGTLICQDSFVTLLKKTLKSEPWRILFFFLITPVLIVTVIFKLNKTTAKSAILWSLTVGKSKRECAQFLRNILTTESNALWFQEALPTFEQLNAQGVEIVIVTASGQTWVRGMLHGKFSNFKTIIGTKLRFFAGGVILKSRNCYQEEKIKRIHEILGHDFIWHSAWSDHIADLPMLLKSQERYIICPKEKHKKIFEEKLGNNYKILNWTNLEG